ncbi:3-deoxy-D-manno-octulosonic-acid transferase [Bisgaardia hudsonensis]|uniref:3-deoxy-D-manno-octulosonic acid transferase n=1 Tax=Bisgaardia hudsonensis TaxID=109472 RepID=A0A4R2MZX7_9PAST|nr:lipid IV(A) 3-deoxy-D-manno-octulosonic acid transferase [Bisgaardia hudsonensis]QLB13662.1 3-deoxy-D-manno-octulosonic acid transferase [Bisgaardia hudsonensis]TCP11995.1 3-deoxy-D-manno-octulosonic-acid transferase [Bisgaardia hudsonensis]
MWRFLYTLFVYLIQPFVFLFMLFRSFKAPDYRERIYERYGYYFNVSRPKPNGIIIHAASVGEVIAATPLIKKIQQAYPELPITFTTVTPTGSDRVKAAFGNNVNHIYIPYDLPDALKRFIHFVQPKACIVIETEIWPNLINQLYLQGIPFIIANARLSKRSAQRYSWVKGKLKNMLNQIALIAPQDSTSSNRFGSLGFDSRKLILTGNIKYDLVITAELSKKIQDLLLLWESKHLIWIAASTHEGEEEIILNTHKKLLQKYPSLLLILAPRHPERFNFVEDLIKKYQFNYLKRTDNELPSASTQVFLCNTMGELMLMYGMANVAFVGGSLVKTGGHNPLEPLAFKCPVISGKYTFNFPDIYHKLAEVNGFIEVKNSEELLGGIENLLNNPELRKHYGNTGYEVLIENRGALQRLFGLLRPYLEK